MKILSTKITDDGRRQCVVSGIDDSIKPGQVLRCAGMRFRIDVLERPRNAAPGVGIMFLEGTAPPLVGMILRLEGEPLGKEEFESYTPLLFNLPSLVYGIDAEGWLATVDAMSNEGFPADARLRLLVKLAQAVVELQGKLPTRNEVEAVS